MSEHSQTAPPDCFQMEEVATLQAVGGQLVAAVYYYLWFHPERPTERFLFFLEIEFESNDALILTSGEDSDAIRVTTALDLIETARMLQTQNSGQASIQRLHASASALWQPVIGQVLQAVRLSKNDEGMFLNDAILLDFGADQHSLYVTLNPTGGLALSAAATPG